MLGKKVKYGESLEHYYYAKINLLNRCKIQGRQAVDCLLYGVEDRAVKVGAQAARFKEPELILEYFRTVKSGPSKDMHDSVRRTQDRKFSGYLNRAASFKPGMSKHNPKLQCFNCNEMGHPSFRCGKPLQKCTTCDRIGYWLDQMLI